MICPPPRSTLFPYTTLFRSILPEHVLAALLAQQDGLVAPLLQRIGADPHLVQARLEDELRKVAQVHGGEGGRSEEHTSELQSRGHLVCRLLLEKKNMDRGLE